MGTPKSSNHYIKVREEQLHPHLRARMLQRGVTREEIEQTLNRGWKAPDAKPGTEGKVFVFPYYAKWEGEFFEEKEVTVYYKTVGNALLLLTVKARYGKSFPKKVSINEDRI
ncbi:MAG: hypothetical protein ACP5Q1_09995 [Anaerolineae bacterium]